MIDATELGILAPAFAAGVIVLSAHVPLGRQVLARGIIFIDLTVAQIAGLGVLAADAAGLAAAPWARQIAAFVAALAAAVILYQCERRWPEILEALIGSGFVVAAAAGILLVANSPHGAEQLKDLLAGQILWVGAADLWPAAVLYAFALGAWSRAAVRRCGATFYVIFALAITVSVQLVGVYLVFASLILPALAVRRVRRHPLVAGYAVGIAGYASGLLLGAVFDLPAGPAIVCTLAAWSWIAAQVAAGWDAAWGTAI